ncbi:MAG: hypothetical protein E7510_05975 [Ruminococcus sp.]|nr:hypothetical protein [Ruminococcus sp.]
MQKNRNVLNVRLVIIMLLLYICFPNNKSIYASGVDNIVARANYMYNATWVCKKQVSGWGGTFYEGNTYHVPYGQPVTAGKYVGFGVSVEDYLSAAADSSSVFYTGRSYWSGTGTKSTYYASDCSAFVSYCWGISRTTTSGWSNLNVTNLGAASSVSNLDKLQPGDALNKSGSHIVLVTAVNSDGTIEITQQTPPQIRRDTLTKSNVSKNYSGYTIYRYNNRDSVPAAPTLTHTPTPTPTTQKIICYPKCDSSYTSLVDALKSIGVDSSKENRKKIAGINGITNYEYTAKQNEELLNKLKDGKLIKEIVNVSCTIHTYGGWTVQTAATCTTDGTQTRKCTACGYTESGTIAKTGHSYGSWTVSKAATCTTDGTNTRKCSKCGNTETSTIAKTGHSYGSWTVSKAATCTTDGTNTRKCSKCGNTETSAIAKTGHNYVDNNVSATCTKDGKTEKKCKNCNDTITTVIKATGHKYGEWTVSKNATCTSDGVKTRKCSVCDASETASVAKTGHNYSETVIKPSCTTKGYTLYECTVCEDAYKDKYTDFAPHNYELTDDKKAECLNCGNVCTILFEGSGTQEDPFKISTAKDLFNLAEVVNNKDTNKLYSECYYVQTADIDLQNEKFTPIGIRLVDGLEAGLSFFGSYNGQYHTIKNLYVERNVKFAGLFGSVKGSGIIENLIVEGKVVSSGPAVGGIIGEICNGGATIRNCAFIGDVSSSSNAVGGVVGYLWLNGTIENCYHNGTVTNTGESHAGGVVGSTGGVVGAITAGKELDTNTSVKKCYHIGEIKTAVPEHASTIVGFSEDLSETTGNVIITDCYAVKGEAYQAFGGTATQKEIIEISNNMLKIAYIDLGKPFVQAPDDSINNGYPIFEWQLGSGQTALSIGDINNDLKCDVTDLTYISLYLLGDVEFDDLQKDAADVNADGGVDIADLAHYKQFISKDNVVLGK